jgi:hypothetical protein
MNIQKSDSIEKLVTPPKNNEVELLNKVDNKVSKIAQECIPLQVISLSHEVHSEDSQDSKNNENITYILKLVNNVIKNHASDSIDKEIVEICELLVNFTKISNKSEIKYLMQLLNEVNEGPLSTSIKQFSDYLSDTLVEIETKEKIDNNFSKLNNDFIDEYKLITEERDKTTSKDELEKFLNKLDQKMKDDEDSIKQLSKAIEKAKNFLKDSDGESLYPLLIMNLESLNDFTLKLLDKSIIKELNFIDHIESNSVDVKKLSEIIKEPKNISILTEELFSYNTIIFVFNNDRLKINLEQKLISKERGKKIINTLLKDVFLKEKIYEKIIENSIIMQPWKTFIIKAVNFKRGSYIQTNGILNNEAIQLLVNDLNKNEKYKNVTTKICDFEDAPQELSEIDITKDGQYAFLLRRGGHSMSAQILVKNQGMKIVIVDSLGTFFADTSIKDIKKLIKKVHKANPNTKIEEYIIFKDKQQYDSISCTIFAMQYIKKFILNPELFDKIKKEQIENNQLRELPPIYLGSLPLEFAILNQDIPTIDKIFEQAMKETGDTDEILKLKEQYSKINKYRKITPKIKDTEVNTYVQELLFKTIAKIALKNHE